MKQEPTRIFHSGGFLYFDLEILEARETTEEEVAQGMPMT